MCFIRNLALALAAILFLTACSADRPVAATPTPTPSPTPLSQPLPTVATAVPLGAETRPFPLVIVSEDVNASGSALEQALRDQTGYSFRVEFRASEAEALAVLCGELPAFGILDSWTLLAAQGRGCAVPLLFTVQTDGTRRISTVSSQVVAAQESGIASVGNFAGRDFCRVGDGGLTDWILPVLAMRSNGFEPFLGLRNVRRLPDVPSMLRAVALNECIGAIETDTLGRYRVEGLNLQQALRVVLTTPEVPLGGLVASPLIPESLSAQVRQVFLENRSAWRDAVNINAFVPAESGRVAALFTLLQRAGLDLLTASR
ncbi:MAG: PhnD/SsuA/transferrin family substrate-binding protein [Anaerolineae bacterium]|nr:PhnD/SsuA/transferrin family substrate-binding protein [Anaerolineae bacterium]MDW8299148.1 PhnD/SsuA/transferrin family substrate-binding protein [Anaerolineae bacterium]